MDIVPIIAGGLRVISGFLFLLFVPGFVIMLVYFPRSPDLEIFKRLVYSTVVSIGSVIVLVLFMDTVLGINTTPGNISLVLAGFSAIMFVVWLCEIWYLRSGVPAVLNAIVSETYQALFEYFYEKFTWDRFTRTTMTAVVWHEKSRSGRKQYDHTYLIDVSEEIDIRQVDEYKRKSADRALMPPPCPRTRYFELFIRVSREGGLPFVDNLQLFPVHVTRNPDVTSRGRGIQRGSLQIAERICTKTDTADIQWMYSHDFHLLALIYPKDNRNQMVNRALTKLDEIALSIKIGSPISSQIEDPDESDRRKFQQDILRDFDVERITSNTFLKLHKK